MSKVNLVHPVFPENLPGRIEERAKNDQQNRSFFCPHDILSAVLLAQ